MTYKAFKTKQLQDEKKFLEKTMRKQGGLRPAARLLRINPSSLTTRLNILATRA